MESFLYILAGAAILAGFVERIPHEAWQKNQNEYPRLRRRRIRQVDVGQIADVIRGLRRGGGSDASPSVSRQACVYYGG